MGDTEAGTDARRKVVGKRRSKKASLTSKDAKVLRSIARNQKENVSRFDYQANNQTISALGGMLTLTKGIIQGNGIGNRLNQTIMLKSFFMRILVQTTTVTTNAQYVQVRLVLFQDKANMGVQPTVTDLFTTIGSGNACIQPINQWNLQKYRILWDKLVLLGSYANGQPAQWAKKVYIDKQLMKEVTYGASTGNDSDTRSNHLYLCSIFQTSGAVNPVLDVAARITFIP